MIFLGPPSLRTSVRIPSLKWRRGSMRRSASAKIHSAVRRDTTSATATTPGKQHPIPYRLWRWCQGTCCWPMMASGPWPYPGCSSPSRCAAWPGAWGRRGSAHSHCRVMTRGEARRSVSKCQVLSVQRNIPLSEFGQQGLWSKDNCVPLPDELGCPSSWLEWCHF